MTPLRKGEKKMICIETLSETKAGYELIYSRIVDKDKEAKLEGRRLREEDDERKERTN